MPAIDNKTHTLLQGLSDFWTRFYADTDELNALYRGTEVLFAQAYLDMLSSFLNISIVETPLFNTELFKLIALREDQVLFDAGVNAAADRHRFDLPDNLVEAHILQNKVIDPTASFEKDAGYEIDATELELRFEDDPSGYPGRVLATVLDGNLLTFGVSGNLKRFYVTSGAPFALAKPGHWFKIQNSAAGNNATYRVARVVDSQALLLQPTTLTTLTTPDPNTGNLKGELIDSGYTPATGFAHRVVQVAVGGSFDDPTTRQTTEIESWYPDAPVGLGVRKGDVIRILDLDAVPSVPLELDVALVRHEKLYLSADNAAEFDASPVTKYVVLREPSDPDIIGELRTFAQVGTPKSGTQGSFLDGDNGTPVQASEEVIFETTATTLAATDRQRFITVRNSAPITWTASIAADGTLTRTAGMENVFVRSAAGGSVTISGSATLPSNNGTRTLQSLVNDNDAVLVGQVFVPETGLTVTLNGSPTQAFLEISEGGARLDIVARVAGADANAITVEIAVPAGGSTVVSVVSNAITVTPLLGGDTVANIAAAIQNHAAASNLVEATEGLAGNITAAQAAANLIGGADSMTNGGTYRIKKFLNDHQIVLDLQSSFADANNGSLYWTIHDGFQTTLAKSRLKLDSVVIFAGVGDAYTGGRRRPIEDTDYTVNSETGLILQIGRHAGTWGVSPQAYFNYSWYLEIKVVTAGAGVLDDSDTVVSVNETAMWAPDVLVDRFNLYNNYGYLINRFDASSETYREFIRGVFQLYILGPTLERLESALNVIAGFPVVRDDDELLKGYDGTSDPDYNIVTTLRPNGDTATYQYPKTLNLRSDVQNPANVDVLTFESFEPLTLAFQTSDHVQDPSWWTNLVIPKALMPNESTGRRRTVSALIENIIGAWDGPRIGDPGFFIGADDEGNVPPWGQNLQLLRTYVVDGFDEIFAATKQFQIINAGFTAADKGNWIRVTGSIAGNDGDYQIDTVLSPFLVIVNQAPAANETSMPTAIYFEDTTPAKRRKMANVVMERFLRWNIFFVRFDETVIDVLDADFIDDLLELILVAKPGYRYMFIEPLNRFEDTMLLTEDVLDIIGHADLADAMVLGEDALTLQTFSWDIGDYWRFRPAVIDQALVVADGIGVPNGGGAIALGEDHIITKFLKVGGAHAKTQEDVDYDIDYKLGTLTPKTVWPAGIYTIDFRSVLVTPSVASFDPSTDFSALSLPKYWGKMQCADAPYAANPLTFLSPGLRIDHQTEFFTAPVDQRTCGIKAQGWGFFWQATEAEGFCDIAVTFDNMIVSAGDCYAGIAVVADPRTSMRSAANPFTDVQWIVGVRRKYDGAATDDYELFCSMDADTRVIATIVRTIRTR
jgi:hypothetical protein